MREEDSDELNVKKRANIAISRLISNKVDRQERKLTKLKAKYTGLTLSLKNHLVLRITLRSFVPQTQCLRNLFLILTFMQTLPSHEIVKIPNLCILQPVI